MTEEELSKKFEEAKKYGIGIEVVAQSLQEKFKYRADDVVIVYQGREENFLNGFERNDLDVIEGMYALYKEQVREDKVGFVCAPYGVKASNGVDHMRSLIFFKDYLIVSDPNPFTQSTINEKYKKDLGERFGVDESKVVNAISLDGIGFQEEEWECGIYSYLKIAEIVNFISEERYKSGFDLNSLSMPDKNLDEGELKNAFAEMMTNYNKSVAPPISVGSPSASALEPEEQKTK